jgi:hypothetical protein
VSYHFFDSKFRGLSPIDQKHSPTPWTFFGYLFDMDQDKQTKPRKRFVGKARKQEDTTPDSNNIEDGAVGFASMFSFSFLIL